MPDDHLLSPDRTLVIDGTSYTLHGSFRTLKAIQHHFGKEILALSGEAIRFQLRFDEMAAMFRIGIQAGDAKAEAPALEAIEQAIVEDIGINDAAYLAIEWLTAAVSPKKDRAGNVQGVLKALEAVKKAPRKK